MNKRMKKKRALEERVRLLESHLDFALRGISANQGVITKLEAKTRTMEISFDDMVKIVARNTQATNNRFDSLESENKSLRVDLTNAVVEFNKAKKPFWKR